MRITVTKRIKMSTLKLEVGKRYLRRDGSEVTIERIMTDNVYPFVSVYGETYRSDGRYYNGSEDDNDIIRELDETPPNGNAITEVCEEIRDMLLAKNAAYGDSALNPVRVFSQSDTIEQLNVRIDDKLSRISRGHAAGEDAELDLIGYLILKRIAKRNQ